MELSESTGLSPPSLTFLAGNEHLGGSSFGNSPPFPNPGMSHNETTYDNGDERRQDMTDGQAKMVAAELIAQKPPIAGPSRRQNVACDACRAKKIRCQRSSTSEVVRSLYYTASTLLTEVRPMRYEALGMH